MVVDCEPDLEDPVDTEEAVSEGVLLLLLEDSGSPVAAARKAEQGSNSLPIFFTFISTTRLRLI
jgi:hypothetical protein